MRLTRINTKPNQHEMQFVMFRVMRVDRSPLVAAEAAL
jgi:hypothetical protein